jgi:hypothetical protein
VDSGYGHNYSCTSTTALYQGGCPTETNGRATGHNLVWVDCDGNTTQIDGGATESVQAIPGYAAAPDLTFARSDLRSAYAWTPSNVPWAQRDYMLSEVPGEPAVLAVADSLNRNGASHSYCWAMHTDAANAVALLGHNFTITGADGAEMIGSTAAAASANALGQTTTVEVQPFLAAEYTTFDQPVDHTVLTTKVTAVQYEHLALMAVIPMVATTPPTVIASRFANGERGDVSWSGGSMVLLVAAHGVTSLSSGADSMVGTFGKATRGRGESVLDQGSSLVVGGIAYVTVTGGTATVVVGGDTVTVTGGSSGATYQVYAPQPIATVTVNGATVNACRSGNLVSFPC